MPEQDTLAAFADLPGFSHPTVSPDGSEVALYADVTGREELYTVDVETGERTQWSDGEIPSGVFAGPRWSADGDRIFVHRDEGGDEQYDIHAITRDGDVEAIVETEGSVGIQAVRVDGRLVLGRTPAGGGYSDLYGYDPAEDDLTRLTHHEGPTGGAQLSPDGERIAYGSVDADTFEGRDLYVADADGSNSRRLAVGEDDAEAHVLDWHPNGQRLLVRDHSESVQRAGIYDLRDDSVAWFGDGEYDERPWCFLPGGGRFVAIRRKRVTTVPVVYDLGSPDSETADVNTPDSETADVNASDLDTGEGREFDVPDGVTWFGRSPYGRRLAIDRDRVILRHSGPRTRPELWVYDLATDDHEVLVPAEYGPFSPADFATVERITFESDGVPETPARPVEHDPAESFEIDALLWDAGVRPSPLVVYPHGGPRSRNTKSFHRFTQFFTLRGYAVLHVNYRGSTGRGRAFQQALSGDFGGAEGGDIARAVEVALDRFDWLDGDRVAVFGRSYGGFAAYWQLVQYPDLYDAGIAGIGQTDWRDMYENCSLKGWVVKHLGTPEENPTLYEQRSPATHAANLDAPLLILHGVNDPRIPVSQARIFRDALEDAGFEAGEDGDFEYVEFEGEGHGSGSEDGTIRRFELVDDFLARRLGED